MHRRLAGWRRSAYRTSLKANSLQTGNLSGKIAGLPPKPPVSKQETLVPQRLLEQFPSQINRENI
jgi:hypothetical protein